MGSSVTSIVGIGASAGGLEAMEVFLKHAAISRYGVVIQHLDPTRWNFTGTCNAILLWRSTGQQIDLKYT
jgi:chemotaxis response regulator CheB